MTTYDCALCKRSLLPSEFGQRQLRKLRASGAGKCKRCTGAPTPGELALLKAQEVAQHFYDESRGQVDGQQRKVKGTNYSLMAQRPAKADIEQAKLIFNKLSGFGKLTELNVDAAMELERRRLQEELEYMPVTRMAH